MASDRSSLVPHRSGYRRLWMFPRNVRRIAPWKTAQVLMLFNQSAVGADWKGNQSAQNAFRELLGGHSLVREGNPYHPNSGGPRTYETQLACLGLTYQTDSEIHLTRAGDAL